MTEGGFPPKLIRAKLKKNGIQNLPGTLQISNLQSRIRIAKKTGCDTDGELMLRLEELHYKNLLVEVKTLC